MNEDFVPYELAVKLKEKGFSCEYPFAMYDEDGEFYPLYSSDKYYYGMEDFDSRDFIAPTISQVLKWLRKTHNLFIVVFLNDDSDNPVTFEIYKGVECVTDYHIKYYPLDEWSKAEIDAIEYVIDNLI